MTRLYSAIAAIFIAFPAQAQESYPDANRIASVGGAVTEIIYALGEGHRLVARDTTSVYPPAVHDLPDVGYMRRLSPEGVLSVNPDLVLTEPGSGPQETIELLTEAGVPFVPVPGDYSAQGILDRITAVSFALDVPEKGNALAERIGGELAKVEAMAAARAGGAKPRVLFVLSMPGGRLNVGGLQTRGDGIIQMAGAENAIQDFEQYRILADEAVIDLAPDAILMMAPRGDHSLATEEVLAHPAVALTPAGQNKRIIRIDGTLLLGFGPRTSEGVQLLADALYREEEG
ncbi:heme/hemin ABC transporter substrate-binding protein [Halocynthiibacter sp.]|uniref:heme/hemin ABC transporter substrate-binding protein n=1 Tax=Halocynthiibacter sp. TaxID=1979210 RepID=UPI003C64EA24